MSQLNENEKKYIITKSKRVKKYKLQKQGNKICVSDKETDEIIDIDFILDINAVRAILFQGNVGILVIELENTRYKCPKIVNYINEYGRRINLPYIGVDESHTLVAEKITFFGQTEDFIQKGKDILSQSSINDLKDGYIMKPIENLLKDLLPGYKKVVPVLDDRMFVCCMVRDTKLSEDVKKDIFRDSELSQKIYAMAFIDADSASCQEMDMREEILKRCIDPRWRDWETIDAITHHSIVRITGGVEVVDIVDSVVNPFLIQYVYLAIGALVQRATILSLSAESAAISNNYFVNGFSEELDVRLRNLKKQYVYAQNNIFLHELTVQEQGIEEFDMLKNELYIQASLENLDNKIESLYGFVKEYQDEKENKKFNMLGILLALMFIMEPLAIIVGQLLNFMQQNENFVVGVCWFVLSLIGILVIDKSFNLLLFKKKHKK